MSNFYITPTQDKAPTPMRDRKYAKAPRKPKVKGMALPPTMDLIRRENYVPALHNPQAPIRPGSDAFLKCPSVHGTQAVYHDWSHV